MRCPNCSKEIGDGALFCGYCGKTTAQPKKKHIGRKVLLAFVVIAVVTGGVSGFLTARGIIDLHSIIPSGHFKWTDFSEASTDTHMEEAESEDDVKEGTETQENVSEKTR